VHPWMLIKKCGPITKQIEQSWKFLTPRFDFNSSNPTSFKKLNNSPIFNYTTYFLNGLDSRPLNVSQQQELQQMITKDPKGTSFLVYNSAEAKRKISNWKATLPWIKPFYAIKSNPIKNLLRDLKNDGANLDCAS